MLRQAKVAYIAVKLARKHAEIKRLLQTEPGFFRSLKADPRETLRRWVNLDFGNEPIWVEIALLTGDGLFQTSRRYPAMRIRFRVGLGLKDYEGAPPYDMAIENVIPYEEGDNDDLIVGASIEPFLKKLTKKEKEELWARVRSYNLANRTYPQDKFGTCDFKKANLD